MTTEFPSLRPIVELCGSQHPTTAPAVLTVIDCDCIDDLHESIIDDAVCWLDFMLAETKCPDAPRDATYRVEAIELLDRLTA